MAPKEETVASGVKMLDLALRTRTLSPAAAAKMRGISGFTGSFAFGAVGRVGMAALKQRQYYDDDHEVPDAMAAALRLLRSIVLGLGPRKIPVLGMPPPHLVVYSDASYECGGNSIEERSVAPPPVWAGSFSI